MAAPVLLVEFTTDDPDDTTPSWTDVTEHVRSFTTSRGRDSELSLVEAGTATITLSNRGRDFDPTNDATLRPMNRWRISVVMDGPVTEEIFTGYAESYDQQWPAVGKDAITIVSCVDEFKVLTLDRLPNTDPPRDTYADVVLFDEPQGYWRMQDTDIFIYEPAAGSTKLATGNIGRTASPIIGDSTVDSVAGTPYGARSTTSRIYSIDSSTLLPGLDVGGPGDAGGLAGFTVEVWFKSSEATPAAQRIIAAGPLSSGSYQWNITLETSGQIRGSARNSGGTAFVTDSVASITANVWYHLMLIVDGGNTRIYVNGSQAGTPASWSGVVGAMDAGGFIQLGTNTAVGGTRYYDEFAFYRYSILGIYTGRPLAHYTAGVNRGFAAQDPGARIEDVLDAAGNVAARSVQNGTREMIPAFMSGRPPLDMLREGEQAENVDAVLFIAKDGTITFLADGHRSSSPYNTVQATFDDDGTDLPYQGIDVDYSEAFLFNEWTVTRTGGTTTTETDATSVSAYLKRSKSLTDLPITTEADQDAIAAALLAKYKDPLFRVTSLDLLATELVAEAVFPLDIGHRIRVFRTQPGGGRIDQTLFIQKIDTSGEPGRPISVRLSVSPL